jgi:hypothetical protein
VGLHLSAAAAYKHRGFAARRISMDALYMIIAFVVVMMLLNLVSTGRVD